MSIWKVLRVLLTALGVGSIIYAVILFINLSGSTHSIKEVIVYSVIGLILFLSSMGLIQTNKE